MLVQHHDHQYLRLHRKMLYHVKVTLFSKNARATLPRTIGEDNSLCNTVLEPEPEPEAVEQQQSRTEQDQSNAQHKAAIQAASPHLSDLVLVETHNVWLYMKPNLLRGVGKHLQVILLICTIILCRWKMFHVLRRRLDVLYGYMIPFLYNFLEPIITPSTKRDSSY